MPKQIKNIVIVGGGTAGWMTAAALSSALKNQDYRITLIESDDIGTVGVGEATVPAIVLFNNTLGIYEEEFVRETKGTFKLGIEFVDWQKKGSRYFHPFGTYGVSMAGIGFTNYWLRWKKLGGDLDLAAFSAETNAARANKFMRVIGESGPKLMPDITYAYHFDAGLYARYLRKYAETRGVMRIEGTVSSVSQNPDSGFIEKVALKGGAEIHGDLFVDCSGFKGLLIEETLHSGYIDWSHWLPCNSAVTVPCEKSSEIPPYTRSTARDAGWQWRIPLQHRFGNGYVYCDKFINHDMAEQALIEQLDGEPTASTKKLRFQTGMRKSSWLKNCVAIGLSGGFLEPLESTSIHLIQRAIFKLLALFPKEQNFEAISKQFNDEIAIEFNEIKDFLIAHYNISERDDTEFWQYLRHMTLPDSYKHRIELFKSTGETMVGAIGLFRDASWLSVLIGQGLVPKSYHPIADGISEQELKQRLNKVMSGVEKRVAMMPSHAEYLASSGLSE